MTGSLQIKNNKYYAVMNFKDNEGKRRQKWISLDLEVKNNKRKAEQALKKLVAEYEAKKIDIINKQSFSDFLCEWRHFKKFCVKAKPIKQKTACKASKIGDFLLIAKLPQAETVCAPQA